MCVVIFGVKLGRGRQGADARGSLTTTPYTSVRRVEQLVITVITVTCNYELQLQSNYRPVSTPPETSVNTVEVSTPPETKC